MHGDLIKIQYCVTFTRDGSFVSFSQLTQINFGASLRSGRFQLGEQKVAQCFCYSRLGKDKSTWTWTQYRARAQQPCSEWLTTTSERVHVRFPPATQTASQLKRKLPAERPFSDPVLGRDPVEVVAFERDVCVDRKICLILQSEQIQLRVNFLLREGASDFWQEQSRVRRISCETRWNTVSFEKLQND